MAAVVGFAFLGVAVTPFGKQVFLLVVPAIPNAMLCMTTTTGMVQKAAVGRKKRPPLAVKKQLIISPSPTLPKGRLTSSLIKYVFYNWLINNILYLCVT